MSTPKRPTRITRKETRREPIYALFSSRQIGWRHITVVKTFDGLRLIHQSKKERVVKFS